ncbi:hypothetical protein EC973_006802 [Apophysomyces ossiformis]|uniref:Uncharacterized protein n=1 Tax=Apophysomyces ossiformis TaxID=679940 RepID=A0A8H7BUV3_9FUNG|nr:hypothetical protein EC973_006802 [Apophysomyces ossiformis]
MSFLVSSITDGSFLSKSLRQNIFGSAASTLDRQTLSQAVKLLLIAADEFDHGDHKIALNIYLNSVDMMLMAIPNKNDLRIRTALQLKLNSVQERFGVMKMEITCGTEMNELKQWTQYATDALIMFAVHVKRSPLPDLIWCIVEYSIKIIAWMDERHQIRSKAQEAIFGSIKWLLAADEHYGVHEYASEILFALLVAGLKAAVAFLETSKH